MASFAPGRAAPSITGAILAGARARHVDGRDKGLVPVWGQPLLASVAERLSFQVDHLMVVANRNLARYRRLVPAVYPDLVGGCQGPLAGMATALRYAPTELVLCVPCDKPNLPCDLAARLLAALRAEGTTVAVAHDGARAYPVVCLLRRGALPSLLDTLRGEERRVQAWLARQSVAIADFADRPYAFSDRHWPRDRVRLEAKSLFQ